MLQSFGSKRLDTTNNPRMKYEVLSKVNHLTPDHKLLTSLSQMHIDYLLAFVHISMLPSHSFCLEFLFTSCLLD